MPGPVVGSRVDVSDGDGDATVEAADQGRTSTKATPAINNTMMIKIAIGQARLDANGDRLSCSTGPAPVGVSKLCIVAIAAASDVA
jgi:hypothetical protein